MNRGSPFFLTFVSVLLLVASAILPLVSVHSYCENRIVAAVLGIISVTVLVFSRGTTASGIKTVVVVLIRILSVLSLAVNIAVVVYATHLCRHMLDQLK